MKVMRIINIKELIYKSALFSLQCLSETWVTAGLHIWRGHSCDKRPLRWGMAMALVSRLHGIYLAIHKKRSAHISFDSHFLPAWTLPEKLLDPFLEDICMWPLLDRQGHQAAHDPTSSLCPSEERWTLVDHIGSRCTNKILSPQNLQSAPSQLQTEGIIKRGHSAGRPRQTTQVGREKRVRQMHREKLGGCNYAVPRCLTVETHWYQSIRMRIPDLRWFLDSLRLWYSPILSQKFSFPLWFTGVRFSSSLMMLGEDSSPSTSAKVPTMSFWHRSSVNRPCSSFHSLPTRGLPSSLLDWHAHPVNIKETEPNPQLQGVHHDWVNHAPYQWWVYAWPCDIILANGTLGETAKRRWVVERQFCKRFYLMI